MLGCVKTGAALRCLQSISYHDRSIVLCSLTTHENPCFVKIMEHRARQPTSQPAGLSLWTRILTWLTTSPWRNDPPLMLPVSDHLSSLQSTGWLVRQASPRNFVIWRGERLYSRPRPLIVLPDQRIFLGTVERSAVAVALSEPVLLQVHNDASKEELDRIDNLARELGFAGGILEFKEQLLIANQKIQGALTSYGGRSAFYRR